MTGEKALALIKRASKKRIHVVRQRLGQEAQSVSTEGNSRPSTPEEGQEEQVSVDEPNLDEGSSISMALQGTAGGTLKESPRAALFAGGCAVEVDRSRLTEPTMEICKDIILGGGAFQARLVPIQRYCIASIAA